MLRYSVLEAKEGCNGEIIDKDDSGIKKGVKRGDYFVHFSFHMFGLTPEIW